MSAQIDWPRLLGDLQWLLGEPSFSFPEVRTPIGTLALSKHLGISRGAVRNILDGTEPKYSEGERYIALWVSLTGKPAGSVPTCGRVLSAAGMR